MSHQTSGIDESLKAAIERGDKWKSLAGELADSLIKLTGEAQKSDHARAYNNLMQAELMILKAQEAGL